MPFYQKVLVAWLIVNVIIVLLLLIGANNRKDR